MRSVDGSSNWRKCANGKRKIGPGKKKSVVAKRRSGQSERLSKRFQSVFYNFVYFT